MTLGAVSYALILLLAGAFYLFYPGYLSFFVLLLFLILPLLSIGLTLLQRRRYAVVVSCPAHLYRRGQSTEVHLELTAPGASLGEQVRLELRVEPLVYPQLATDTQLDLAIGQERQLSVSLRHCGWYKISVTRCRLADYLGLVWLPLPCPDPVMVLVLPKEVAPPPGAETTAQTGAPLRPRPGGGPGEEYELRPYRPGDPVNAIHWKLTAKQPTGEPVLRETLEPVREHLVVSYDHFGSPEALDGIFDQLDALARHLVGKGDAFTLCHADPDTGALSWHDVDCGDAWERCYRAISGQPAPLEGRGLPAGPLTPPGHPGPVKHIHLTSSEEQEVPRP